MNSLQISIADRLRGAKPHAPENTLTDRMLRNCYRIAVGAVKMALMDHDPDFDPEEFEAAVYPEDYG